MLFVGRAPELEALQNLVTAAEAGAGGSALVEGEAGMGKTRLLEELAAGVAASQVVWGRAWEEPGAPPYWPWRQAFDSLGVGIEWKTTGAAPAVATAVFDALRRASATRPLVVLLDDLHAADADTIRLASFVARSIRELPVALVSAARPSPLLSTVARASSPVRLNPLAAQPAGDLIAAASPIDLDDGRRQALIDIAEGNPLVAIEIAHLAGKPGGLPREIRAIVHDRIDPLPSRARRTMDAAAVLGRSFSVDRLASMLDRTPLAVVHDLEPAVSLDVIMTADADSWRFSHQIVRDVVYEELGSATRIELHAAAARAIANEGTGPSQAELARHLAAALPIVDRATAFDATVRAAEQAETSGAHADAADIYRRALGLAASDDERLRVLLHLGQAALDAGQVADACTAFDDAIALSRTVGSAEAFATAALGRTERLRSDSFALGWLPTVDAARRLLGEAPSSLGSRLLARRALILGEAGEAGAHELAEQAVAEARDVGDLAALSECLSVLHLASLVPERIERAAQVADELVAVAERSGNTERLVEGTLAQLTTRLTVGDLRGADEALLRCETVAATSGHPRHQFFALSRRAMRSFLAGKLSEGDDQLHRARDLGHRIEEPDTDAVFHAARVVVLRDLVGDEELRELVSESVALLEGGGGDGRLYHYVAYLSASIGDLEQARSLLDRALATGDIEWLTQQIGWPFWACLIADTVVALSDKRLAQELHDALSRAEHLVAVNAGAVAFGGVVSHYLGLLAGVLDRPDDARRRLDDAIDRYRTLGAVGLLARALAEREALSLDREAQTGSSDSSGIASLVALARITEGWRVELGDTEVVVPDSRGLQHLARLCRTPGEEVHVLDLTAGVSGASRLSGSAAPAVLDDEAKAAYRSRIADLQADLAEAQDHNDIERAALARAEIDALLDELRHAAGLGGRDRPMTDEAERARVAVRKAIMNAIDRLAEVAPICGQHLRDHVHTGLFCRYEPPPS